MAHRYSIAAVAVFLMLTGFLSVACAPTDAAILFRNATIVDGSGKPGYIGDVRVEKNTIVGVGNLESRRSDVIVDASGLVLAPGFIDSHSHAGRELLTMGDALAASSQGITTVVLGQDGDSEFPLADFLHRIEASGTAVNLASYVGHNTLRDKVLGEDFRRPATADEVAAMGKLLKSELESGAVGFSTGLEYDPGIYSSHDEVLALAKIAAAAGTRYISHVRSEDRWFEDAIDEIIEIGRVTKMPVQVSHIKLAMKRLWGKSAEVIGKLDAARAEGIDITADIYPYTYWQSDLMVLLPERDYNDRDAVAFALEEIAPPDGLWMTSFDPQPEYVGMTLSAIAAERGVDAVTAFMQLAAESDALERETGKGANSIIGTSMIEADIKALLLWDETNICTDGSLVDLHPRSFGSFTRVLGRYVRDEKLLTLEQAVHKMTGLTARHMGFEDRGLIAPGKVADLVLFDSLAVIDRATAEEPNLISDGIVGVWVSGERVFGDGRTTDARPGVVIRRASVH
jgi:N-acyl-D-amino-acid deacylase